MIAKWFAATKDKVVKEAKAKSPKSPKKKEGKKKKDEEKEEKKEGDKEEKKEEKEEKKEEKKEEEKKEEKKEQVCRYFGISSVVSDHADAVHLQATAATEKEEVKPAYAVEEVRHCSFGCPHF